MIKRTAEEALEALGFSWERLEKLARRALHDEMRDRRIVLDPDRYQECLDRYYIEVGARWSIDYDPALAGGVSFASSCYRRMRPRLTDFLRARHGDERRGHPITEVPVDRLPDGSRLDDETFDQAIATVGSSLPSRARWTLEHLGRPIAEQGLTLASAAATAGIALSVAEDLIEELGWRLGRNPSTYSADPAAATADFALLQTWTTA